MLVGAAWTFSKVGTKPAKSFSGVSSSLRGAGTVGGDGPSVKRRSSHCCPSGHQPLRGEFCSADEKPSCQHEQYCVL